MPADDIVTYLVIAGAILAVAAICYISAYVRDEPRPRNAKARSER